jgi:hypothetical protein
MQLQLTVGVLIELTALTQQHSLSSMPVDVYLCGMNSCVVGFR